MSPLDASHPAAIAALVVAAACVLVSVSFRLYDAETWEHLAVGRTIWQGHVWPVTNLWTWPTYGEPNVNPSWGFSALLWPFWAHGGVTGLFAWRWLTTLASFTLLWLTARRLGARGLTPLVVLAIAALVYRQRSQVRPETLAAVWFALTLWLLESGRAGRPSRYPYLVPVAGAWANTHVSYWIGLALMAIHLAGAIRRARLALVMLACIAISFVNPTGWHALARPFEFALLWRDDPLFAQISELQPLDWAANVWTGLPILLVGWPVLVVWRALRKRGDVVEGLVCLMFSALVLAGSRFVSLYSLACAPYFARDLATVIERVRAPAPLRPAWARAGLACALCVGAGLYPWARLEPPPGIAFDQQRMPVWACEFIARTGIRGRALNHFYLGGYLLWRFEGKPDLLPFMDIHPEDTAPDVRLDYLRALISPIAFDRFDLRWRFDWALLSRRYSDRPGILDILDHDPSWALVFVDDVAAVYVRRDGELRSIADRYAYRVVRGSRMAAPGIIAAAQADSALRIALAAELARQAHESPVNFYGRSMLRTIGN